MFIVHTTTLVFNPFIHHLNPCYDISTPICGSIPSLVACNGACPSIGLGDTALHWAVFNDRGAVVEKLISVEAKMDAANNFGASARF